MLWTPAGGMNEHELQLKLQVGVTTSVRARQ
jgi:hypothetical protein